MDPSPPNITYRRWDSEIEVVGVGGALSHGSRAVGAPRG